jgi:peptidyl-tRNA hydrolase, PTH1 family
VWTDSLLISCRGHNGIKSLQQTFSRQKFIRIAVGIGRPLSREPKAVADYVLKKMTSWEKEKVEAAAGQVLSIVTDIQYGTYKP